MSGGRRWRSVLVASIGVLAVDSCTSFDFAGDPCTADSDCDRGEDKHNCLLRFPDGYCSSAGNHPGTENSEGWGDPGYRTVYLLPTCRPDTSEPQPCHVPSSECVAELSQSSGRGSRHCPYPYKYAACTWGVDCRRGYACTDVSTYESTEGRDCNEQLTKRVCLPEDRSLWTEIPPEEIGLTYSLCDTE
jgi:hypothetical protein